METERLIRTLALDAGHTERPIGVALTVALLLAAPVSVALFMLVLGVRPDVATAMHNPFFNLKFVVTIALACAGIAISLHLTRPEATLKNRGWLLLIPVGLIVLGIGAEMMLPQERPWQTRLIGNNAMACVSAIPLFSLPLLIATLFALRRGAPSRPAVAGAIAGLLAAGLGATLYASHCSDDSPLFVATWYLLAVAMVAAVGAVAGSRMLRF